MQAHKLINHNFKDADRRYKVSRPKKKKKKVCVGEIIFYSAIALARASAFMAVS